MPYIVVERCLGGYSLKGPFKHGDRLREKVQGEEININFTGIPLATRMVWVRRTNVETSPPTAVQLDTKRWCRGRILTYIDRATATSLEIMKGRVNGGWGSGKHEAAMCERLEQLHTDGLIQLGIFGQEQEKLPFHKKVGRLFLDAIGL